MRISRISRRAKAAEPGARRLKRRRPDLPALEWTEDVTGRCPRLTAVGSHSLLVENHTGILAFGPNRVLLGSRSGAMCVLGEGLALSCVRSGALIIRGDIRRVELPCRGGDSPDEG